MEELLKSLWEIFQQDDPVERERRLRVDFYDDAEPILHSFFNIHLDYCLIPEDGWTQHISSMMSEAQDECLRAAREGQIDKLIEERVAMKKASIGLLCFAPLAASIAQRLVRSAKDSLRLLTTHSASENACNVGGRQSERSERSERESRVFTPIELEEGPEPSLDPHPFSVAVALLEPVNNDDEQVSEFLNSQVSATEYHNKWKQLRQRLFIVLTDSFHPPLDAGTATDLLDRTFQRVLSVDSETTSEVLNPYGYAKTTARSVLCDDLRKANRHVPLDNASEVIALTPSPEQAPLTSRSRQ